MNMVLQRLFGRPKPKIPPVARLALADIQLSLRETLVGCHGVRGAGSDAIVALAGRSAGDIATAMKAFRANERPGTIMGRIARGYTDAEIAAIADYFASVR